MKTYIAILLLAGATATQAQNHFQFVTGKVVDITDRTPVYGTPKWEVWARKDSLYIGVPERPILLNGIAWTVTDNGTMYFMNKYIHLRYTPPGVNEPCCLLFKAPNIAMELYPKGTEY